MNTFSLAECATLSECKVCVMGCGAVGSYIIEMLARLGIGSIVVVDGGSFSEKDLNRELFCTESNLGEDKVLVAKRRVQEINSEVEVIAIKEKITEENCRELISGSDIVVEALDNMKVRAIIDEACTAESVVMIHGAIMGWYGQVSTIYPGDTALRRLYPNAKNNDKGAEKELVNPSFTPALVASIETAEVVKVLLHKGVTFKSRMLSFDLLLQEYEVFNIN